MRMMKNFSMLLKILKFLNISLMRWILNCGSFVDGNSLFRSINLRYIKSISYLKSVVYSSVRKLNKFYKNTKFSWRKFFLSYFNTIYFSMFIFKSRYIFYFSFCIKKK